MNKRGTLPALAVIMALSMALAACGNDNDGGTGKNEANNSGTKNTDTTAPSTNNAANDTANTTTPDAPAADEPVTLKLATWIPADDKWTKMLELFNAKFPNIKVDMISWQGTKTLQENIAAGEPVDVFWANTMWEPLSQGYVENLQPYIDKDPEFGDYPFLPGILDTFKVGNDIYGLSRGNDLGVIYYNKDILEKYGIDPPAVNWTFDDMREMAKKATNAAEKTWGFNNTSYNIGWLASTVPYANGHTEDIYGLNKAHDKIMWTGDNTAALDDLNYFYDIVTKDQSMLNWGDSQKAGYTGGDLWEKGQALFNYGISFQIPGWSNPDSGLKFKWDIAPIPAGTATQANYAQNNPMFMAAASKHKEAAWEFMKFWTTNKDFQNLLADNGYTFPNSSDADIQAHFKSIPSYAAVNQEALAFAYNHPIYDPSFGMIGGNFAGEATGYIADQVIENKISAYDNLPKSAEEKNGLIAQAKATADKVFKVQAENEAAAK
ncbi:extracellular solute-binding protein [Paenibacillus sacheonensis]|nr:extracellular solute-binding protein [Paenibacillus sacheonensis]